MALLAIPFKPSYTALKNLCHKIYKHTTTVVNLTLPIWLQDLSIDVNAYLDDTIGMLSDLMAFLYDDDAPWAVRVIEVKKGVDRVDVKVYEVKTKVVEIKTEVAEIKTEVAEIKTGMRFLKECLENQMEIC